MEDKLSPSYERKTYKVTGRHGNQVVLQSSQGVEYQRNFQHVNAPEISDIEGNSEPELGPPNEATSPERMDHQPIQEHVLPVKSVLRLNQIKPDRLKLSPQTPWPALKTSHKGGLITAKPPRLPRKSNEVLELT